MSLLKRQSPSDAHQVFQSDDEQVRSPFTSTPPSLNIANSDGLAPSHTKRRMRFIKVSVLNFMRLRRRLIAMLSALVTVTLVAAITLYALGGVDEARAKSQALINQLSAFVGLSISEIEISVPPITKRATLIDALKLAPDESLVTFDVHAARDRLLALPSIKEADISKLYPSGLKINVTEFEPVARWQIDKTHFVISPEGKPMGLARSSDVGLPLLVGQGAGDVAAEITVPMAHFPMLQDGLVAFSRIAERRWDLLYSHGLRVRLPGENVPWALERLARLNAQKDILQRDLALIDLRQPDQLVVRPTDRAVEKMKLSETGSP